MLVDIFITGDFIGLGIGPVDSELKGNRLT